MYKLYITSLFIISLSVHQIESVNVTLKSSVNDVNGNSFTDKDKIHLTCKVDLDNDKEELVSLKINFGKDQVTTIYDYKIHDITNCSNINGANVTAHDAGKNEHSVMITNPNDKITGPYTCAIVYNKEDKKSTGDKTSESLTIPFWSGELKSFVFTVHDEKDLKKDKDFKSGETLVLSCTANYTDIAVESIDIQHNTETICTYKDGKGIPAKTKDIAGVDYLNSTKLDIKIPKITDKAKGTYLCKIKVKNGDKDFYTGTKTLSIDVKNAGSMSTISFALIVISLISTRFSK